MSPTDRALIKRAFGKPLGLEDILGFGKHKDKTIQAIYLEDSGYLVWMRDAKKENPAFFTYEVHCLLDMTIEESKPLKAKYKRWNVQQDNMDATTGQPVVMLPPVPKVDYAEAWGAF